MKKFGWILIFTGALMIIFYNVYVSSINIVENEKAEEYIEITSSSEEVEEIEEVVNEEIIEEEKKEEPKYEINYTAVLEIPKINLKRGVVDSTNNFKSLNYAISVDRHSKYPNNNGNFILYAHSGSSSIAYFKNLNKVELNDDIYVYYSGIKYKYTIIKKYDIEKTGKANIISSTSDKYITLITCNQNRKGYQTVIIGKLDIEKTY